ncbi:MAG: hypothetical protein ACI825_000708 [Planctomycetota bacterium]|jgi:hypothetical protein|uniref:hypothetical protein n=1 Tax=Patiriisocius sp. Uisw_047 TaxID=3230969 RepID=UPI0039ECC8A9
MANVRNLKRDVNYVIGDIIEAVYIWELTNPGKDTKESQAVIDSAIKDFDELIVRINAKKVEDKKAHFKAINQEVETKGRQLIDRINSL